MATNLGCHRRSPRVNHNTGCFSACHKKTPLALPASKRRKLAIVAILIFSSFLTILFFNSKSIQISFQGKTYLRRFLNDWNIHQSATDVHKNFETEFNFISLVQDSVLSNLTGQQIPHAYFGDVRFYYQKRQGICYDRAVLLEKIFMLYDFPFRHTYLYFGDTQNPSIADLFKEHVTSHAALEVKTKKGWMAVGTDANWLGISKNGKLKNYSAVRKELETTNGNPRWLKSITMGTQIWKIAGYRFRIIYGLYSRHGDFLTGLPETNSTYLVTNKRHLLPDYNLKMLSYNI